MNVIRGLLSFGLVVLVATLIGTWFSVESQAQAADKPIVGAWTRNKALSDAPADAGTQGQDESGDRPRGGSGRGGGRGGGRRGGGFGGGGFGGAPRSGGDPDAVARMREAIADIMNPPDHLIIVQAETMVIMTGPDGRTTRFLPDGSKVKDDNTGIERKSKWDGDTLVCEISGAGPGKITQTYSVDTDHHQLRIAVQAQNAGGRGGPPRSVTQVYEADAR